MGQGVGIERSGKPAGKPMDMSLALPSITLLPVCGAGVHLDVVLYGDNFCGKTCLAIRYERNRFGETTATIGEVIRCYTLSHCHTADL